MSHRVPRILALAGSTRSASWNRRLIGHAADEARRQGSEVRLIELRDFPLPLYDGDLEQNEGLPAPAVELQRVMLEHDALLLAAPEYNSSITAVLKNAIDWVSRPVPGKASPSPFRGKVAALLSASPGALGGLRGLVHVRSILGNLGVIVLPDQLAVTRAHEAFDADGRLLDEGRRDRLREIVAGLVRTTRRLNEQEDSND